MCLWHFVLFYFIILPALAFFFFVFCFSSNDDTSPEGAVLAPRPGVALLLPGLGVLQARYRGAADVVGTGPGVSFSC